MMASQKVAIISNYSNKNNFGRKRRVMKRVAHGEAGFVGLLFEAHSAGV
jgi:hypothetical protein